MEHRDIPASQNHGIVRWYYTTTGDMAAATVSASDVGKLAQVGVGDAAVFYALVGVSPNAYKQLGSAPAVPYVTGFDFAAGQLTITLSDSSTLSVLGVAEYAAVDAITAALGAAGGIATLDGSGQLAQQLPVANLVGVIDSANLPSYVDDVLEYADFASLPVTGEAGKIYITLDTNSCYRWSGSAYIKIADDDVLFYADLASFPVSGSAGAVYLALDTKKIYIWTGAAYEEASAGLSPIADQTILGNVSGSTATPVALTKEQVKAFVAPLPQLYRDDAPAIANVIRAGTKTRAYVWGSGNYIGNSANSVTDCAILSGTGNSINSSVTSTTGPGMENVIAGGRDNLMGGGGATAVYFCTIGGGLRNRIFTGNRSAILNGTDNAIGSAAPSATASGDSVVVGGQENTITTGANALIGGGRSNTSNADYSVIAGGYNHTITGANAFIGGGSDNSNGSINGTICGGNSNTITAVTEGFIGGGISHTVSGSHGAIVGGYDNTASGPYSFIGGGRINTASGDYATVSGGFACTASGYGATVPGGVGNVASGQYSVATGLYASTLGRAGSSTHSAGRFTSLGDAQRTTMLLRQQTTNATQLTLTADQSTAASASNTFSLQNYELAHVRGRCLARNPAALVDYAIWEFTALVYRDATAATTAFVSAVTPTLLASGGTGNTWVLTVLANTTHGALEVRGTGEAAKTISWFCELDALEITDIS